MSCCLGAQIPGYGHSRNCMGSKGHYDEKLGTVIENKESSDACDCPDCAGSETPCQGDCASDALCQGCAEANEAAKDREFDEKCALGYE